MVARPRLPGSLSVFDLLLWAFIVAGMTLRLWGLPAMEFKADEFNHMVGAYTAARAPWSAPLLQAEGTGISPGVFFYQLLAAPVALTRDPVAVTRFIALVNIAAIPLLFVLLRRLFEQRTALWATALFATAPWMIVFSRKIWNPDLLLPFLIFTLALLFSAMRRYARWKVYAFAVLLALLSQLHLSVWLAIFPLLPLGLLLRPWRRPLDLASGVALFLGVYLLTLGPRISEFLAAFARGSPDVLEASPLWLMAHNARWSARLASGTGFDYLLGRGGYEAFGQQALVPFAQPAFLLHAGLIGAASLYVIARLASAVPFPERSDRLLLVLLLMAGALHALYVLLGVASFPHYHVILMLLPAVFVAAFLAWIATRFGRSGSAVAHALLLAVLVANVSFTAAFLGFVARQPEAIDGDYGQPYFVQQARWERELEEAFGDVEAEVGGRAATALPATRLHGARP